MVEEKGDKERQVYISSRGKEVFTWAEKEALMLGGQCVDTHHLLLGLMRDEGPAEVFAGTTIDLVRQRAGMLTPHGYTCYLLDEDTLPMTQAVETVLGFATEGAVSDGSFTVTPFHLMDGILILGQGGASAILGELGISRSNLTRPNPSIVS